MAFGEDPDWKMDPDEAAKLLGVQPRKSLSRRLPSSRITGGSAMPSPNLGSLMQSNVLGSFFGLPGQLQNATSGIGPSLQASAARMAANRQAAMQAQVQNRALENQYILGQGKLANMRAMTLGPGWAQDPYLDALGNKKIELAGWDMADPKTQAEAQRRMAMLGQQEATYRQSKGGGGGGIKDILDRLLPERESAAAAPAMVPRLPKPPPTLAHLR